MLNVKIKKLHKDAVIPKYETNGAVGMDLTAVSVEYDKYGNLVVGTGLAIQLPEGYYADLRPRSSISKYDLVLANSIGTVDADYTGELILKFKPSDYFAINRNDVYGNGEIYKVGDRVAQLLILPYPKINFIEVDELDKTERGNKGFGSTGK